jgi:hypothetical protein
MKKHTQNNFLTYLIVLGSFFVLIFFTKDIYWEIQEKTDTLETQNLELTTNKAELSRLKKLQLDLLGEDSQAVQEIRGFSWDFSDENIINHIYSYVQKVNLWDDRIIIRELSLSGGEKSDLGFTKAGVNLDIITSSEETLFGFFNYLTDIDSDFRFYISNFDYDLWGNNWNITVSIPLIFYYK